MYTLSISRTASAARSVYSDLARYVLYAYRGLVVCYALPVLCTNLGVVLAHCISAQYGRSLHGIGHVYIGAGQHTILRIILGIIETASTLFRSVSLALRTVCNATAGHVLLAVLLEMTLSRYTCCLGMYPPDHL